MGEVHDDEKGIKNRPAAVSTCHVAASTAGFFKNAAASTAGLGVAASAAGSCSPYMAASTATGWFFKWRLPSPVWGPRGFV